MLAAEYDFDLPDELIALRPAAQRDASRLMVLKNGAVEHRLFRELPELLLPGDLLILNNTKVFPARLIGQKPAGGRLDMLLIREAETGTWEILSRGGYSGPLVLPAGQTVQVRDGKLVTFTSDSDVRSVLWQSGLMPLPPYIRREPDADDNARYQTVYANKEGSIAAPTAGLHFTPRLIQDIVRCGVAVETITLHVGTGTFRPVRAERVDDHVMDAEAFEIATSLLRKIDETRSRRGRVIAVGTTTTRALEGYASGTCDVRQDNETLCGTTDIFIREGYRPRIVDALITNFHLPRSTPLMLTAVFAGRLQLLDAYRLAIREKYRFFSYGDAMLVL